MRNVIVSGADGFVGSNTVRYLLARGCMVLAVGTAASPVNLRPTPKLRYVQADATSPTAILPRSNGDPYDTFIHFAWAGSAGEARSDMALQMKNALGTVEAIHLAKRIGCRRFVGAGSIMEREVAAAINTQGTRPETPYAYGVGKLTAHCLGKIAAAALGLELVWPILTNAYGEGERSPRFVNTTLRRIMTGKTLRFTAATQNYDFVHISDVARAFYLIAKNGKPFCEYLIGSSNARPLREFILEMQQTLSPEQEPLFGDVPFTGTSLPLKAFDTRDTERDTGFRAKISFAEGIGRTMEWLKLER